MDFLFGEKSKTKTKPIYNPQQEDLLNQIMAAMQPGLGSGFQNLQNILGGDQESMDAFQAPARRAFEQQTLPTIAERFTGTFGTGSQRSSAFGQSLGQAGRELEENLAAQRANLQSGALSQLMGFMPQALAPRQYQYNTPGSSGIIQELLSALAQGAGGAIGGGIPGAIAGAGKGIMNMFQKNQGSPPAEVAQQFAPQGNPNSGFRWY